MSMRLVMILGAFLQLCASCGDGGSKATNVAQPPAGSSGTTAVGSSTSLDVITLSDPVVAWLAGIDQNWDGLWPAAEILIDNGCVMLTSPDGTAETVLTVWPTGTKWGQETSAIVLPDGFVVREGDVIEVGGGAIPFDQGSGNNVDVSGLGVDGLAKLQGCAADHPGLQLWLLDADGSVGPVSSAE